MNGTGTEQEPDNQGDNRLQKESDMTKETRASASWRSGYAADCKSVYTGSIPVLASNLFQGLSGGRTPSPRESKRILSALVGAPTCVRLGKLVLIPV